VQDAGSTAAKKVHAMEGQALALRTEWRPMTKVLPYFQCAAFDPDMTHIMGEAFDRACKDLHVVGQPGIVKEVIASRIINVARDGERDPRRLYEQALNASGFK
jgi:hypothetical protein